MYKLYYVQIYYVHNIIGDSIANQGAEAQLQKDPEATYMQTAKGWLHKSSKDQRKKKSNE